MIEIIKILEGSYSPLGITMWFERPRFLLEGRTPNQALADGDFDLVFQLAKGLLT